MVLYSRRRRKRRQLRPCVIRDGELCSACKEDIELERNIQDSGVQDKRWSLRTQMNANHDPFILKFPPEIAFHILYLSMEEQDYNPNRRALKKLPMQFLLGTICRAWRQLVRSTPELWSALSFTLAKPMKVQGLQVIHVVTDWLLLSGDLPLTLRVWYYGGLIPVSQLGCAPFDVIDVLNQHSGRWHEVFFRLPASLLDHLCGTSPPNILCNLRVVRAYGTYYCDTTAFRMSSRPSPTHLFIGHFPVLSIDILWDNLRFLKLKYMVLDACIEVIRQAPLLESCSVVVNYYWWDPLDVPSFPKAVVVRLTHLRQLSLSGFTPELLTKFLDILEPPSLEDYSYTTMGTDIAVDGVISLLGRSRSCLKHLRLSIQREPVAEDLKKLLNAVPYLQTLKLELHRSHTGSSALLQVLSSSPPTLVGGIPGFLPHLQSLNLSFISCRGSTWKCIPEIYSWPHRKILSLEIYSNIERGIKIATLGKILRLIDQGLDIRIHHDGKDYLQQFKKIRPWMCSSLGLRLKQKVEMRKMRRSYRIRSMLGEDPEEDSEDGGLG